jgi:hypothetical protein
MDRLLANTPAPTRLQVVDPKAGFLLTKPWLDYFERIPPTLDAIPSRLNAVNLTGQTSSLPATDFSAGTLLAGLYRLNYYSHIKSPSGGGSLTVTFRWTDDGDACSFTGISLILLSSETFGTMSEQPLIAVDKDSPVTYETAWTGGQHYKLAVTLEKVRVL